ncbi:MAG TPA: phosphoglycerate mutase [Maritimibacter sp.]|nr:phosphoglycerate mutase [Maritimibacter sp.]
MTLRLILTRHAKSSWDDPLMSDHDRPLNKRGRASAQALGRWLDAKGYTPDEALVSSAERTRETWDTIARTAGWSAEADIASALYLSEPDTLLNILRGASGQTVMMIAHNPGCSFMAQSIVDAPPQEHIFDRFPTGATAVVEFGTQGWDDITWRSGRLVDFAVPRELIEAEEDAAVKATAAE